MREELKEIEKIGAGPNILCDCCSYKVRSSILVNISKGSLHSGHACTNKAALCAMIAIRQELGIFLLYFASHKHGQGTCHLI